MHECGPVSSLVQGHEDSALFRRLASLCPNKSACSTRHQDCSGAHTEAGPYCERHKSHLVPEQTKTFIGITLNSVTMSATLSHTRTDSIFQLLTCFHMGARIPYGVLLHLMGMLAAATSVIPLGLLHLRPLQRWNNSLGLNSTRHRYHMIVVTPACVRALKPWKRVTWGGVT